MIPVAPAGAAAPAAGPMPAAGLARRSFAAVLERVSAPAVPHRAELAAAPCLRNPSPSPPARLLEVVDRARARLDGVLAAARSGRTFTAQELLGLQAEAYRTAQTVDLGAKVVEQGAQAVRQTLATQV